MEVRVPLAGTLEWWEQTLHQRLMRKAWRETARGDRFLVPEVWLGRRAEELSDSWGEDRNPGKWLLFALFCFVFQMMGTWGCVCMLMETRQDVTRPLISSHRPDSVPAAADVNIKINAWQLKGALLCSMPAMLCARASLTSAAWIQIGGPCEALFGFYFSPPTLKFRELSFCISNVLLPRMGKPLWGQY